jgi:hypothetical protein
VSRLNYREKGNDWKEMAVRKLEEGNVNDREGEWVMMMLQELKVLKSMQREAQIKIYV